MGCTKTIIVPGPASKELGFKIAEEVKADIVPIDFKIFPDGESYIRFTKKLKDEDVVLVQTTAPKQDTSLLQLIFMIDTAKDLGAKTITAIVPYIAYARQDERFREGEAISSRTVFKILNSFDLKYFITIDFHNPKIFEEFKNTFYNLSAIPLLAKHFKKYYFKEPFSLAPDDGAIEYAKTGSKILGGNYGYLKKFRDRITGEVQFEIEDLTVDGKDAIVFDDIISTGKTMAIAIKKLKSQNARRIYAACVHPILVGNAVDMILDAGAIEIIGTDCISSQISKISIASLVAEDLKRKFQFR